MDKSSDATIRIIEKGGRIILKCKDGSYLHSWTNIASGPDHAVWTMHKKFAADFFDLRWARTIAPLYRAHVVVAYPCRKAKSKG